MNMMFSKFLQDRVCFRGLLVLLLMLLIPACAQIQPKDKPLPLLLKDHPLAGKIYDVKQGRFIEQDTLPDKLRQARYILLGETHDNIAHHLGEQWALNQLAETKRAAGSIIAFEMIDEDQGKYLAETRYTSVDELIGLLHHVSDQWGYDTYYRPVFEAALRAKFTIVPASPSRENIIKIVREGKQGISPDVLALMEKTDLGKEQTEASHKEIEMSHCGMSNEKMVEAMMRTQRAKDAFMTLALMNAKPKSGKGAFKILVAGSGHVRDDRGVPLYIQQFDANAKIVSVGWLEVAEGVEDVKEYSQQWGVDAFPFDYIWFTPRADRPDPCEAFRKHMKKKHGETEK